MKNPPQELDVVDCFVRPKSLVKLCPATFELKFKHSPEISQFPNEPHVFSAIFKIKTTKIDCMQLTIEDRNVGSLENKY